jgi:DNA-binding CsgD family transcriptional regulator
MPPIDQSKYGVSRDGRPTRLSADNLRCLAVDLKLPPTNFGFGGQEWSGKLLSAHLLNRYGVVLSPRQCRRMLRSGNRRNWESLHFGEDREHASPASVLKSPSRLSIVSDQARKESALRRIKRLCSSGLPLHPLATALFELMGDAIPHCENRVLLADDGRHLDRYLANSVEVAGRTPDYRRLFLESPPDISGMIPVRTTLEGKLVWRHEEITLPHFYRSEGYNEFMRHLGFHHILGINLRDHLELAGAYPLWRSADMGNFTTEDVRFAQAAAPYIAHALRIAARLPAQSAEEAVFVPSERQGEGVIILNRRRRVAGVDAGAQAIFQRIALFEKDSAGSPTRDNFDSGLSFIQGALSSIFNQKTDPFATSAVPAVRFYCHRTGLALKMRGVRVNLERGDSQTVILIEAGELAEHRRQRLMYRHDLTPRLMELMDLIGVGLSTAAIAQRMRLSRFTLRDYVRRLGDRLGIASVVDLRRLAMELSGGGASKSM